MLNHGAVLAGRYWIDQLLGQGELGEVYLAEDQVGQAPVAVKALRPELSEDPEFVRQFRRQAGRLARLDLPNVMRFYGFYRTGPLAFTVNEYVPGETLRRRLAAADEGLPLAEATSIFDQVAHALDAAHRQGIIHGDVKPGNILLHAGAALLFDFGLVRAAQNAALSPEAAGTPSYMSPEQLLGRDVDGRTDVYSLAAVLYEMVTGHRPFNGERGAGSTIWERLLDEHVNHPPLDPRQHAPGLPPGAAEALLRGLAKSPAARWQDTASFARAWQRSVGRELAAAAAAPAVAGPAAAGQGTSVGRTMADVTAAVPGSPRPGAPNRPPAGQGGSSAGANRGADGARDPAARPARRPGTGQGVEDGRAGPGVRPAPAAEPASGGVGASETGRVAGGAPSAPGAGSGRAGATADGRGSPAAAAGRPAADIGPAAGAEMVRAIRASSASGARTASRQPGAPPDGSEPVQAGPGGQQSVTDGAARETVPPVRTAAAYMRAGSGAVASRAAPSFATETVSTGATVASPAGRVPRLSFGRAFAVIAAAAAAGLLLAAGLLFARGVDAGHGAGAVAATLDPSGILAGAASSTPTAAPARPSVGLFSWLPGSGPRWTPPPLGPESGAGTVVPGSTGGSNAAGQAAPYLIVRTTANVRGGPGTAYPVVGGLPAGARAPIRGRNAAGGWWQICCVDGISSGWISAALVSPSGALEGVPVVAAAPAGQPGAPGAPGDPGQSPVVPPPATTAPPPTATVVPPTTTAQPPAATAVPPTATVQPPTVTARPPTATAVSAVPLLVPANCPVGPQAAFGALAGQPALSGEALGCPVTAAGDTHFSHESFEHGQMVYRYDQKVIYVLYSDGTWAAYPDTYVEGQPLQQHTFTPPPGFVQPIKGFDRVWERPDVRGRLGWGVEGELGLIPGQAEQFMQGSAFWLGDARFAQPYYVLFSDGKWAEF